MKIGLDWILLATLAACAFAFGCGDDADDDADDTDSSYGEADGDADGDLDSEVADYGCVDEVGWYIDNSEGISVEVKQLLPNAFGLYDMLGNVIEWNSDCYHDTYSGAPTDGSIWDEAGCEYRVQRGGCFGAPASALRVSKRDAAQPTAYGTCTPGVRCARDMGTPENTDYVLEDLVWVEIPGGAFIMGCTDAGGYACLENEYPTHEVTVPSFYMTEAEITGRDFYTVTQINPNIDINFPQRAASKILFDDAKLFCESIGARLPTEAEWEYAARGGTTGAYYCQ